MKKKLLIILFGTILSVSVFTQNEDVIEQRKSALIDAYNDWLNSLDSTQLEVQFQLMNEYYERSNDEFITPMNFWVESGDKILFDPINSSDLLEGVLHNNPQNPLSKIPTSYTSGDFSTINNSRNRLFAYTDSTGKRPYTIKNGIVPRGIIIRYTSRLANKTLDHILDVDKDQCHLDILSGIFNGSRDQMADSLLLNRNTMAYQLYYFSTPIPSTLQDSQGVIPVCFNMGRLCPPKCPGGTGAGTHIGSNIQSCSRR